MFSMTESFFMSLSPPLKCFVFANLSFWTMALFFLMLDKIPRTTWLGQALHSYKIQGSKSYMSNRDMIEIARVAAVNMIIWATVSTWVLSKVWYLNRFRGQLADADPWVFPRELNGFIWCVVINDLWFYGSHRLLHVPWFYARFHKQHHKYTAPCAMAAVYAHPVEFLFGNLAGVAMGPVLAKVHPYTAYLWYAVALSSTCANHSGYSIFGGNKHDAHHELFNYNYGTVFTDALFGTSAPISRGTKIE